MEEETLGGDPKGGGKEELREEEWVSLNTLSLRKTKIWLRFGFPATAITACRANFEKSYITKFWLELSHSYAQIEALDI